MSSRTDMADPQHGVKTPPPVDPPHDINLEQALLGAVLVQNSAYDVVSGILEARHFYEPLHRSLWELIDQHLGVGRAIDANALRALTRSWERVSEHVSVPDYVVRLVMHASTTRQVRTYAETLVSLTQRRELLDLARHMIASAEDAREGEDASVDALLEDCEVALSGIATRRHKPDARAFPSVAQEIARDMDIARANGGTGFGLTIPLTEVQRKLRGLHPGDVYVLAGRPGMGKTALSMDIAVPIAHDGHAVHVASMEMPARQVVGREIAKWSGVPLSRIQEGDVDDRLRANVLSAVERYRDLPLHIDETPGMTVEQLASRARKLKRRHDTQLLVIDYLQLMRGSQRGGNRVGELSHITMEIKILAKELGIPVLLLSQLSRAVEQRENKRPVLADLRESGSIEQDADVVMFAFREEYYLEREEPANKASEAHARWLERWQAVHGTAELIIAKQRNGPTGVVKLAWSGKKTKFSNFDTFNQRGGTRE